MKKLTEDLERISANNTLMAEKQQQVFESGVAIGQEQGKQAQYDEWWDEFQDYGNRTWYWGAFAGPGWTDKTLKPKHPIRIDGTIGYTFRSCEATVLPRVEMISTDCSNLYYGATKARKIHLVLLNGGKNFTAAFSSCSNLENVTIEGLIGANISFSSSSKLTDASVQNIIDHLADVTGQTSLKITFHNTVGSKLTEAQKEQITAKNWTLAY